jgi:hypothetical protein
MALSPHHHIVSYSVALLKKSFYFIYKSSSAESCSHPILDIVIAAPFKNN